MATGRSPHAVLARGVSAKHGRGSEQTGVEEFEKAPQVRQTVLHRRSRQGNPVIGFQQPRRFGALCGHILDGLCFVEHNSVEVNIFEKRGVAPQGSVRCKNQIVTVDFFPPVHTFRAGMVENSQAGRKPRGFLFPVEDQRPRHDDEAGPRRFHRVQER